VLERLVDVTQTVAITGIAVESHFGGLTDVLTSKQSIARHALDASALMGGALSTKALMAGGLTDVLGSRQTLARQTLDASALMAGALSTKALMAGGLTDVLGSRQALARQALSWAHLEAAGLGRGNLEFMTSALLASNFAWRSASR
jgi:hypothetical protein